jgi:hypothetical protein
MSKITYTDKVAIYENASIPEINKITDGNMNEIKRVVNENDDRLITAETDINNAEAVIGNETDTYSASSTYALGSLVIYGGLLYKCTTAITVAEAWTIAHWTQVSLTSLANDGDAYSTKEQIVGKWIDGKPIYRKVLEFNNVPAGITQENHGISNFYKLINYSGYYYNSTLGYIPIPAVTSDNITGYGIGVADFKSTTFGFNIGNLRSSTNEIKLIVEYTKTTD